MKVAELIEKLKKINPKANVRLEADYPIADLRSVRKNTGVMIPELEVTLSCKNPYQDTGSFNYSGQEV